MLGVRTTADTSRLRAVRSPPQRADATSAGPSEFCGPALRRWAPGRRPANSSVVRRGRVRCPVMNAPFGPALSRSRARGRGALGWLLVLTIVAPAWADGTKLRGKVDGFRNLVNPVWAEARDPKQHGYSFREPVATVRAEFRRL